MLNKMFTRRLMMKIGTYAVTHAAETYFKRTVAVHTQAQLVEETLSRPEETMDDEVSLMLNAHENEESVSELNDMRLSPKEAMKIKLFEYVMSSITGKPFKFNLMLKMPEDREENTHKEAIGKASEGETLIHRQFKFKQSTTYEEKASFSYQSKGFVKTADGKEIRFNYKMNMSRRYYEANQQFFQMDEIVKDPLILNFDGKGLSFSKFDIEMDLDLDNKKETFKTPAKGSGFLAIDKNNNGAIDDGAELFGPTTGHGFLELAAYDEDENGWIDENDAIFDKLKIVAFNEDGSSELKALSEEGVGAIYIASVSSPYGVKEGLVTNGNIKNSSFYLRENGKVGMVHEVDLKL